MTAPNGAVPWPAFLALAERVARTEEHLTDLTEGQQKRGNRAWLITVGLLTGLVCPVVVTTIITLLHLRAG